ncbi:MAG: COG4223 family protein [Planktomarina sp.]
MTPINAEDQGVKDEDRKDAEDIVDIEEAEIVEDAEVVVDEPVDALEYGAGDTTAKPANGGFKAMMPLVLGGVVAGGIGFGIASMMPAPSIDPAPMIALQEGQSQFEADLTQLRTDVTGLQNAPAPKDFGADISELSSGLVDIQSSIRKTTEALDEISARLDAIENRPLSDQVAPGALAAFETEMQKLRDQIAAQMAEVETITNAAKEEVIAAKNQATTLEQEASAKAQAGAAKSALNAISAAIANGGGYAAMLEEFAQNSDQAVPGVLADNAETGFATLAVLQADFPVFARQALAAARGTGDAPEGESGIASFFKSQLNVRSLTPKEGNDPDAVLSRAEDQLSQGNVALALDELNTLPAPALDVLAPWVAVARDRVDAQTNVADLLANLP